MADKKSQRDELAAKDRRIDDLIEETDGHIASLLAVVEEMKRRNLAQKRISEDERRG